MREKLGKHLSLRSFLPGWLKGPLRSIRSFWHDTSITARRMLLTMLPVGLLLSALGVWGDKQHYWDDQPFATNFFSSFVGAMCGIPVAVVIVQRIAAAQESHASRRRRILQAILVMQKIRDEVTALVEVPIGQLPAVRSSFIESAGIFREKMESARFDEVDLDELNAAAAACVHVWNEAMVVGRRGRAIEEITSLFHQLSLIREQALVEGDNSANLFLLKEPQLYLFGEWVDGVSIISFPPNLTIWRKRDIVKDVVSSLQRGRADVNLVIDLIRNSQSSLKALRVAAKG